MQTNDCAVMVRLECANFKRGRCLFAGECPVMEGQRCSVSKAVLLGGSPDDGGQDYFGACVAPLAKHRPEYAEAAAEYARLCGQRPSPQRYCACGAELAKGKQCCASCRKKRAVAATRKYRATMSEKFRLSA